MRFMMLYTPVKEATAPPSPKHMAEMGRFIEEMAQSGVLLSTDGLQPSAKAARVRLFGGRFAVTDGPCIDTKERIAGYAIVEVKSKDEAIALAKRFLNVAGEGASEIRQMHEAPAFGRA